MLLFDNIKGFPRGYRVSSNTMSGIRRMALGLGLDPNLPNVDLVKAWKEKLKTFKPLAPKKVKTGPVLENVFSGKDVDLLKFPAPKWHEGDGGHYIGTGCCVFLRDPDEDWVNMGVYRVTVHNATTLGIFINHIQHGRQILQKYWSRQQNCPVVVSFGQAPSLYLAAAQREPWGVRELSVAGWLAGSPVEIISGEVTGFRYLRTRRSSSKARFPPMDRESLPEGPFGERTGYYATGGQERAGHQSASGDASQRSDHSRRSAVKASAGNGSLRHSSAVGCRVVRVGI